MRLWLLPLALSGILVAANPKDEKIPMRDGVRLSASISLPPGPGPFPAILSRTPNTFSKATDAFVEAGYAVVQQNLRGIQESEGKWASFTSEAEDGYDTVE
jgi:putative CocE/NonD family hydrolase